MRSLPREWTLLAFPVVLLLGTGSGRSLRAARLQRPPTFIVGSGKPSPGQVIRLDLISEGDRKCRYQLATALGGGPTRFGKFNLPIAFDPVFFLSVSARAPQVFESYAGVLNGKGRARAKLHLPDNRAIIGIRIHSAFITFGSNTEVQSVSRGFMFTVYDR